MRRPDVSTAALDVPGPLVGPADEADRADAVGGVEAFPDQGWRQALREPATLIGLLAVGIAVGYLLLLLSNYRSLFVRPEWHIRVLPESLETASRSARTTC